MKILRMNVYQMKSKTNAFILFNDMLEDCDFLFRIDILFILLFFFIYLFFF